MAKNDKNLFNGLEIDETAAMAEEAMAAAEGRPVRPIKKKKMVVPVGGRPRQNPYAQDKKLTTWVPKEIHRALGLAAWETGKSQEVICVEALAKALKLKLEKEE